MSKRERLKYYLKQMNHPGDIGSRSTDGMSDSEREVLSQILEAGLADQSLELLETLDEEGDWNKLKKRLQIKVERRPKVRTLLKYAAVFVGLLSLGLGLQWTLFPKEPTLLEDMITLEMGNDVKPITEDKKQIFTLPSGKKVAVKEANTLTYEPGYSEELVHNELHIPNGKMFTLVLSDGTEIHLNSGTQIQYPVKFPKTGKREVTIQGEAFFKVARDVDHPFIVKSGEMSIEVLGTSFNVSAYEDENTIHTVLIEGSVSLSHNSNSKESVLLAPGNKASWSKSDETLSVYPVDTLLYTSWISGEIVFRDTPFPELIKRLERSYNVIINNGNRELNGKTFNARYNRKVESIQEVMEALKVIVPFEYNIRNHGTMVINIE